MPRKQRFKPSRKPKPAPNEEPMNRQPNGATAHNDNAAAREEPQGREPDPSIEPDTDSPSR